MVVEGSFVPFLASMFVGAAALVFAFIFLFIIEGRRYVLFWAFSWIPYIIAYGWVFL